MNKKTASERYIKLSGVEHVLKRPDTYVGSIQKDTKSLFVAEHYEDIKDVKMVFKDVTYSPGFIKIFDEAITNASDHSIRTGQVTYIKINIEEDNVSIENDGPGVPVVIHDKEKIYIPEMIFGNLLSGENYDDTQERFIGGRNGIGIKCTNIFSKKFIIETADGNKSYKQTFTNNMSSSTKPITRKSKHNYTKITYYPDFERFDMDGIDSDTMSVLIKRVLDISAYNPSLKITLNNKVVPVKSFRDYMKLFTDDSNIYYEKIDEYWEIGVAQSPTDYFTHVSMVNGISTILGGTHVNLATNMVVNSVKDTLTKTNKDVNIKPIDIKNRLLLFVNCKIINPVFDNQTKENLTSKLNGNTKNVKFNDSLIRRLSKSQMFDDIIELSRMKEKIEAQKELNKGVTKRVRIPKLVDANKAGSFDSHKCYLFLTEGDCLHEDTHIKVIRYNNIIDIKIKDVKIDDAVITHNNNIGVINNISKKIEKSVKIKLKNGNLLICSKKHRWYIYDKLNNEFTFKKTTELDIENHKMIINKNAYLKDTVKIKNIINYNNGKFNKIIYLENGEDILSTNEHKFSIFDIKEQLFKMIECQHLDKDIHYLVNYEKI